MLSRKSPACVRRWIGRLFCCSMCQGPFGWCPCSTKDYNGLGSPWRTLPLLPWKENHLLWRNITSAKILKKFAWCLQTYCLETYSLLYKMCTITSWWQKTYSACSHSLLLFHYYHTCAMAFKLDSEFKSFWVSENNQNSEIIQFYWAKLFRNVETCQSLTHSLLSIIPAII